MPARREFTEKLTQEICDRLSGGESIRAICADLKLGPATVYQQMAKDEDFRNAIARAREAQQEFEADRCIEMADEATPENWQVQKLRIWARQWRAAKLAPKKYGDRVTQEITGKDGGPIETVAMSDRDRAKALAALVAKAKTA